MILRTKFWFRADAVVSAQSKQDAWRQIAQIATHEAKGSQRTGGPLAVSMLDSWGLRARCRSQALRKERDKPPGSSRTFRPFKRKTYICIVLAGGRRCACDRCFAYLQVSSSRPFHRLASAKR